MGLEAVANSLIREVRRRDALCVQQEDSLISVIEQMREQGRGAVAIVDDQGLLIGIFSTHDLVERVDHSNHDWHTITVSEVMTSKPVCVREDDTLALALQRMKEGTFRHLPRVDSAGRPTAILSVRDIMTFVSENFPKEFVNLPPEPGHEAKTPWGG